MTVIRASLAVVAAAAFAACGASAGGQPTSCTGAQLAGAFKVVPGSAGAGNIVYELTLKNTSTKTCTVTGLPQGQLLGKHDGALPTHIRAAFRPAHRDARHGSRRAGRPTRRRGSRPTCPGSASRRSARASRRRTRSGSSRAGGGTTNGEAQLPPTPVCEHGTLSFSRLRHEASYLRLRLRASAAAGAAAAGLLLHPLGLAAHLPVGGVRHAALLLGRLHVGAALARGQAAHRLLHGLRVRVRRDRVDLLQGARELRVLPLDRGRADRVKNRRMKPIRDRRAITGRRSAPFLNRPRRTSSRKRTRTTPTMISGTKSHHMGRDRTGQRREVSATRPTIASATITTARSSRTEPSAVGAGGRDGSRRTARRHCSCAG